jgi:hypothetical protein
MENRKLIFMLWIVIAILVLGGGIGGYLLVRHANDIDQTNSELTGNNDSLKRQLQQAKATPTPSPTPSALATPEPTASPSPTVTPKATASPKP